jgi:metallo-beta-lactamase class B
MPKPTFWREPWSLRAPAFPITKALWYVGNRDVSCHLVKTSAGAVLIDTAFAETSYLLVESLFSVGVQPADVALIIHTHGHVDHCGATRRMKKLAGAPAAMGERDVETVEKGTPLTCAEYHYGFPHFETFTIERPLRHGDTIEIGDVAIRCHYTPGHTAGTMSFTFETILDGRSMTVGLFGGPGLWTMTDEHRLAQGYPGNREDFRRSLDCLKRLDLDIWLGAHPGQNDTFGKQKRLEAGESPNPFIEPEGWKRFVGRIEREFERL